MTMFFVVIGPKKCTASTHLVTYGVESQERGRLLVIDKKCTLGLEKYENVYRHDQDVVGTCVCEAQ